MPRKKATENGSPASNPFTRLMEAFQKRVHQIVEVIDEALGSDELKHRIWAVELLLKRFAPEKAPASKPARSPKQPPLPDLSSLSDEELMARIRRLLHEEDFGEHDDATASD